MATTKKTAAPEPAKPEPRAAKTLEPEPRIVPAGGVVADDLDVLNKDIDTRMAALLKDHQAMGARPK